jgi:prephenate dehydrogenase
MPGIALPPKLPFRRVGIAGLGLIGGSLAKALMPFGGMEIYAFDKDGKTLETARKTRRFAAVTDREEIFLDWPLDLAYLCLPVQKNVAMVGLMGQKKVPYPVTDAGSTKAPIVRAAMAAGLVFCGGHPISGREVSGYAHSSADLFRGCLYILTPPPGDDPAIGELLKKLMALHKLLQCNVKVMPSDRHDRLYGLVSHLPFLAASALAGAIMRMGGEESLNWAGSGFKDSTRISAAATPKWLEIVMGNADNLAEDIGALINILSEIRRNLQSRDAEGLKNILEPVCEFRKKYTKN